MNFNRIRAFIVLAVISTSTHSFAANNLNSKTKSIKNPVGFLAAVSGDVKVDNKAAKSGDPLFVSSNIQTSEQGKLQVLIGDGMVALLGHNTVVKFEKYGSIKIKERNAKKNTDNLTEFAQFELEKGSLRLLVKQDEKKPRQGKVRSGKDFAIVNNGEAFFNCDEACAKKSSESKASKK